MLNHALDQFLEDLLDIGIDQSTIVRLGSKSSQRTFPLSLSAQRISYSRSRTSWNVINTLCGEAADLEDKVTAAFGGCQSLPINAEAILEFLEIEDPDFYEPFAPQIKKTTRSLLASTGKS